MEDPVEILGPKSIHQAHDLLVWKHRVQRTDIGFCPASTCFPNPIVQNNVVVSSIFAPGQVYALDRVTGELCWHYPLAHLGHTPTHADGMLFVGDSNSLLSLSPDSGKKVWEFTPPEGSDEKMYSLPLYTNGKVFIGDREGTFYCLSAETGEIIWSVKTSTAENASVNATPLVFNNLIITATNARLVIAYEQSTGQEVWHQRLSDRSIYQVQTYEGMALIRTRFALYGLSPNTGEIIQRWQWRGKRICSVAVAGSILCVAVSNELGRGQKIPAHPLTELLGIHGEHVRWRLPYSQSSSVDIRWDAGTELLYEAMYCGVGIVDPGTGTRNVLLTGFTTFLHRDTGRPDNHVALPSVKDGNLYILHTSGTTWALQHPEVEIT